MRRIGRILISISILRALAGVFVISAFDPMRPESSILCLIAFALAQASDQIDGWLARKYSTPTTAGYLQDAISDKLFHVGCLLALSERFEWVGLTLWFVVARELVLLGVRVVSTNVDSMLKRYKLQSLIYAALLRFGIVIFFFLALMGTGTMYPIITAFAYLTLNIGVGFGVITTLLLLRLRP
jgi:phosphatidylglycerophosphate synthase